MTGHPKAEMVAAALAGVYTGDQLMKGMKDRKEGDYGDMNSQLVRAAIGAAVAVGALKMMRADKEHLRHNHEGTKYEDTEFEENIADSTALAPSSGEDGAHKNR